MRLVVQATPPEPVPVPGGTTSGSCPPIGGGGGGGAGSPGSDGTGVPVRVGVGVLVQALTVGVEVGQMSFGQRVAVAAGVMVDVGVLVGTAVAPVFVTVAPMQLAPGHATMSNPS